MSRFADLAAVTRYPLADSDDWVEFRNQLSYGEARQIESAALQPKVAAGADSNVVDVAVDWSVYEVVRLAAWCKAWSFTLPNGKQSRPSRRMVDALTPATVGELSDLLDAHLAAQQDDDEGKAEPGTS